MSELTPEAVPFEALPLDKNGPRGNAWGLFGKDDALGMLNHLTPEKTIAATQEVEHGVRVSTDWSLAGRGRPFFGRQGLTRRVHQLGGKCINDDVLTFNTQASSQWDGFRHFGYQAEKVYFGGLTQKDIAESSKNGIDAWVEKGGIFGRGVLLDWASWVQGQPDRTPPDLLAATIISLDDLKAVAAAQGISFRPGDILLIRSGLIPKLDSMSQTDLDAYTDIQPEPPVVGVESTEEMLRWIWDHQFAAVAGDMITFESQPVKDSRFVLHEWLIAGWGLPIGELFDLESLAVECKRYDKWTFLFSSMPLKVPGGIASPPNGIAIL